MCFKFLSGKSDEYVYWNYKINPFKFRFFTGIEKYNFDIFGPYHGGLTFNNDFTHVAQIEAPSGGLFYTMPSFTANYVAINDGNIGIGVDPTAGQEYTLRYVNNLTNRETPYYFQFNNDNPVYISSSRNNYSITLDSSATQGVVFHSGNNTFRIFAGDNNLEE